MHKNLGSLNLLVLLPREQQFFFLKNTIILWLNEFQILNSWLSLHQIKLEFLHSSLVCSWFLWSSWQAHLGQRNTWTGQALQIFLTVKADAICLYTEAFFWSVTLFSVNYLKILYTFSMLDRITVGYSPVNYSTWKYLIFRTQAIYIQWIMYIAKER